MVPDINEIDLQVSNTYADAYRSILNKRIHDKDEEDFIVPKLNGTSNWRDFKDKLILKLSTNKGTRDILLEYLTDISERTVTCANTNLTSVNNVDDFPLINDANFSKENATHFGPGYNNDNSSFFTLQKKLFINTPAYNHIFDSAGTKDGRKEFFSLCSYYEDEDYIQHNIQNAFNKLNNNYYKGEHPRHNFEKFVSINLEAHRLLFEAKYNNGLGMDNTTKIQHFQSSVNIDAGLEHTLTTARTNKLLQGSFQSFISFPLAEVDNKGDRKPQLSYAWYRRVSVLERGLRGGRGGQHPFRGRGRGRGR